MTVSKNASHCSEANEEQNGRWPQIQENFILILKNCISEVITFRLNNFFVYYSCSTNLPILFISINYTRLYYVTLGL